MLLAHNWKKHHHIFKSLTEAYACAKAEIKDIVTSDELIRPVDINSSTENYKKHGFKSIFEKSVDEWHAPEQWSMIISHDFSYQKEEVHFWLNSAKLSHIYYTKKVSLCHHIKFLVTKNQLNSCNINPRKD